MGVGWIGSWIRRTAYVACGVLVEFLDLLLEGRVTVGGGHPFG